MCGDINHNNLETVKLSYIHPIILHWRSAFYVSGALKLPETIISERKRFGGRTITCKHRAIFKVESYIHTFISHERKENSKEPQNSTTSSVKDGNSL